MPPPETGMQSDFQTPKENCQYRRLHGYVLWAFNLHPHHILLLVDESWNLRIGALNDSNLGSWVGFAGKYTICKCKLAFRKSNESC